LSSLAFRTALARFHVRVFRSSTPNRGALADTGARSKACFNMPSKRKQPTAKQTVKTEPAGSSQVSASFKAEPESKTPPPEEEEEDFRVEPSCEVPRARNPIQPDYPGAYTMSSEDIIGTDSHLAYVSRWHRMREEERRGSVCFRVVTNDGSRPALVQLLGLKNVFVRQLPNMPRPYVVRLVFDRKHESLIMIKKLPSGEEVVMGGCCYRPFSEQRFAEIAFLAISHSEQVRGYGTRLMAHTKERAKALQLTHLLTCADNNAVAYFKKQGFSKIITLPPERWQGYIKDYEGIVLMECALNYKVDYLNIPPLLKAQKLCLLEKLREVSRSHIVYPGIDVKKMKGIRIEDIPGLQHVDLDRVPPPTAAHGTRSGVSSAKPLTAAAAIARERDPVQLAALQKELQQVLNQIKSHSSAWPFLEPVDPQETGAYNYYEIIKNPMDLRTIQERLDSGWYYVNRDIFLADLNRMVKNAIDYNGPGHYISELALSLKRFYSSKL
jgi:histone acetyltransferase